VVGSVEGSYGITIAERVGLPQEVIQGARQVLRKEEVAFNELLLSLSREREEMRRKLDELHERLAELGKREEEVQALRRALEEERRRLTRTLREDWEVRLREREKEIARLVGELRKARALDEEKYGELKGLLQEERRWLESLKEEREEPQEFQAGDRVFVDPLGRGVVLEVDMKKGEVLVAVGERRVRVAPERLRKEEKESPQESPQTPITTFTLRERITNEVTIRALKAEEALAVLERYLDRAILAGFTTVYIIHGKGEGKLRQVTHEFLRSHPYVQEFRPGRPEEGGLGVTVVTLRT
jgi:DNA mismatch repair protein MutS2